MATLIKQILQTLHKEPTGDVGLWEACGGMEGGGVGADSLATTLELFDLGLVYEAGGKWALTEAGIQAALKVNPPAPIQVDPVDQDDLAVLRAQKCYSIADKLEKEQVLTLDELETVQRVLHTQGRR